LVEDRRDDLLVGGALRVRSDLAESPDRDQRYEEPERAEERSIPQPPVSALYLTVRLDRRSI